MSKLNVISFWAGPGAGKSTTAAGLFYRMKQADFSVELVTEVYKDWTWEKNWCCLKDRLLGVAEQNHRLQRLEGQVEWAITDSPIPLTLAYCSREDRAEFLPICQHFWRRYWNYGFLIDRRDRPYSCSGRSQTLDEAIRLDDNIKALAPSFGVTKHWNTARGAVNYIPGVGELSLDQFGLRKSVQAGRHDGNGFENYTCSVDIG